MSITVSRQSTRVVSDLCSENDFTNISNIRVSTDETSNNQNNTCGQAKGSMNQAERKK
jgi:hypothetical protein